jgi:type I restriction enzyme R subunit
MSSVGQREIQTQKNVITFFKGALGYAYLGHWQDREGNAHIEEAHLRSWLQRQGHAERVIDKALSKLGKAAALGGSTTLYDANRAVYGRLRYGVKVRPGVGEQTVTVWPVDWENPENNDFAIAEEVTVNGVHTKRPDLVLYVNGIALLRAGTQAVYGGGE